MARAPSPIRLRPLARIPRLYFPRVMQGMNLRIGRFISIPGVEAQLPPTTTSSAHTLLYSIDPFTDTGILATIKLNDQWLVQAGIGGSHDVALWTPTPSPPSPPASTTPPAPSTTTSTSAPTASTTANTLRQHPAIRRHLVPPLPSLPPPGQRSLVHVRAICPRHKRPHQTRKPAPTRLVRTGRITLHRPEYAAETSLQQQLSAHDYSPCAATSSTTRKASAPATPPATQKPPSCGPLVRLDRAIPP